MNVYFTATEWLDPSNMRRSRRRVQDYLLSSLLYFDVDVGEANFDQSIQETSRLVDYIEKNFGRNPSWIIFSGRRGFHIYYWDWENITTGPENPRERVNHFIKSRKQMLKELNEVSIRVDPIVTADPWRLMRAPGTLHGRTGRVAVPVYDIPHFTPDLAKIPV
jgi:DNA primase catalytic subunit